MDNEVVELTEEEERLLRGLSRLQSSRENAESKLLQKYASRAAIARQVWGIGAACVVSIVLGTIFVLNMQNAVERNSAGIVELSLLIARNTEIIQQLRLDLKDKADRARP